MINRDMGTAYFDDSRRSNEGILYPSDVTFNYSERRLAIYHHRRIFELNAEIDMTKKQANGVGEFVKQAAMLTGSFIALAKATAICSLISPIAITSLTVLSMAIITFMILKTIEYKLERNLTGEKNSVYRIQTNRFFAQGDEQIESFSHQADVKSLTAKV